MYIYISCTLYLYIQCTCTQVMCGSTLYVLIITTHFITAVPPVPALDSSTSADAVGGAVGGVVVVVVILLVVVGVVMWKLS